MARPDARIAFETDRLLLRELTFDDLDDLAAIYADPEVMRYITGRPRTREETRDNIAWLRERHAEQGYGIWAFELKETGALVGRGGLLLHEIEGAGETEVAYALARDYWGRGLATEAAAAVRDFARDRLGLDRLIAIIKHGNLASQRVARAIGMEHARDVPYNGEPHMLFAMTLGRPEGAS